MTLVVFLIFALVAAIAAGFAVLPLLLPARGRKAGAWRPWHAALAALFIAGAGLGIYLTIGQPQLALRALTGPDANDFRGLVAALASRIRERPDDARGWALLGRSYLALNNADEAAKALARAIALSKAKGAVPASLYSAYGEALAESSGAVTPEAKAAFQSALAEDPNEPGARYYLGFAARARGDKNEALKYWEALLKDAPANASWRRALVDQVAVLKAEQMEAGGAPAPDINAMVQGLASRLAAHPDDLEGWMRLVRAYAVMGEPGKAKSALAKARAHFANDAQAQKSLTALARDLALERG